MVAALGVASLAAGFMVMGTAVTAQAEEYVDDTTAHNIKICHIGAGETDNYAPANPAKRQVAEDSGHATAGAVHPRDIIPPFAAGGDWEAFEGQNWGIVTGGFTGEAIWENGCAFPRPVNATAVDPNVLQAPRCDVEGTYTIPATPGVQYLLGEVAVAAGTYNGPVEGEITAVALSGYQLTNPDFSFRLDLDPAQDCETSRMVSAVAPTVVQSPGCDVEGSYTIPTTTGVQYLLDNVVVAAGTYSGPRVGVVTAQAATGYNLTDPDVSFALNVAPAADCYVPPPPPVDLCSNIDGSQATVPDGYQRDVQTSVCSQIPVPDEATAVDPKVKQSGRCGVEGTYTIPATAGVLYLLDGEPLIAKTYEGPVEGVITAVPLEGTVLTNPDFEYQLVVEQAEACPAEVLPTEAVDVCPNLPGGQEALPSGYEMEKGKCLKIEKAPAKPPVDQPDEVLGTEEAVPTEVDAGLVGPTDPTTGGPSSPLGQGLMGAGLMVVVLAGTMQAGRRERGVHEA